MIKDAQETRKRLIQAARQTFTERGFERTTVREIAGRAAVNPALINRYFGGKEQLFAEAVSIDLELPDLSRTERRDVGRDLVAHFFRRWEGDAHDDLLQMLIRTAATNSEAAVRIRSILTDQVTAMVCGIAGPERAGERAYLIATQILGLAYTRYVLGLAENEVPQQVILASVGETLNRYLFENLA